ncbi:carboxypeptidase regulatory-like domain-containing protein [Candidatus Saccharibacteria bacterium]|nr:MAG: carboxypeptidase regulatory-like domain-containing protein [Candidatus Saccharibacteria bacterium]
MSIGLFSLFTALVSTSTLAKQRSVGGALASNQKEYLRSLPFDSLAVSGGSIISSSYIPATITKKINGTTYVITTSISYVDDAYDGCGPYPNLDLKIKYCRNYSSPGNSSNNQLNDTNPADYKIAHVVVKNSSNTRLAAMDTHIAARVAETASTTGALFVTATDSSGNAVPDAIIRVINTTTTPAVNVSDTTDANGMAIFYGLPPDTGLDYAISVEKNGYSSVQSIRPSGSLQPTYSNQKILAQQSSYLAFVIAPMDTNSLIIETVNTSGAILGNVRVQVKGGYKKYTEITDNSYYYDNLSPTDVRVTTDVNGIATVSNLPPINSYIFCGASGSGGCAVGGTTYYLASAVPYGGTNSLAPITVPVGSQVNPVTFTHNGSEYIQKVRLILTNNSSFPRVFSMSPDTASLSDNLQNVDIVYTGANLSNATASLTQNGTTYSGNSCVASATQLTCNYNLNGITTGDLQVTIQNASGTLILPTTPLGGFRASP